MMSKSLGVKYGFFLILDLTKPDNNWKICLFLVKISKNNKLYTSYHHK